MAEISKSPGRLTFQKERYVERCESEGKLPSIDYLEMYISEAKRYDSRFDDPKSRIDNMEYDLLTTDWILNKVRSSEHYAQNLYAAICNNDFMKNDVWPILKKQYWHCSWRYAGGIVADMRQQGDYIDWYCSGIKNEVSDEEFTNMTKEQQERYIDYKNNYVAESVVTEEIREDLLKLGWIVIDDDNKE
jgi:hypothetical protein